MSQIVGYQLLDQSNNIVGSWGGIRNQMCTFPNPMILPNGDQIAGVNATGQYQNYFLVNWVLQDLALTSTDVNTERDRRIESGFMFLGKLYDSRPDDQTNIAGASQLAFMAIVSGKQAGDLRWHGGTTDFGWIAHDNIVTLMDAQTIVGLGRAAAAWKQTLIFTGRAIKNISPIPVNYKDDSWWPSV